MDLLLIYKHTGKTVNAGPVLSDFTKHRDTDYFFFPLAKAINNVVISEEKLHLNY